MSNQRHIIQRQIIEWTVSDAAGASAFQDEVSRIYHRRIIPLIDQCCSELSQPDRVYRIEKLDLDLGEIDSQQLEEQFVARVHTALREALTAQINYQEQDAAQPGSSLKARSALELFAFFVRTGSLPWWVDATQPGLLDENIQELMRETPQELQRLLQTLSRESSSRERIAAQYRDEQLAQLCGLLVPDYQMSFTQDIQTLIAALQMIKTAMTPSPSRIRQSVWVNLLQVAALGGQQYPTLEEFYRAVLERVAAELGKTLVTEIQHAEQGKKASGSRQFKEALKGLNLSEDGVSTPDELVRRLAQLQVAHAGPLAAVLARLQTLAPRLSDPQRVHWLAELNILLRAEDGILSKNGVSTRAAASRILRLLNEESTQLELGSGECATLIAMVGMGGEPKTAPVQTALDLSFREADELPVANAGLVILWPFLTNFFTHLGLMEDKQFKDPAAQLRAVGLLQVIAMQDAESPEYELPLNKLLCGLEPQQVFSFGRPLRKSEGRQCVKLLKAVIAQAPILHNMTVAGFTGSFLLRQGLLSVRDGLWLLRVERQTYDIVLERFPWSWQWVKLPWMESPLRVEW